MFSIIENLTKVAGEIDLDGLYDRLKSPDMKQKITLNRMLVRSGQKEMADEIKKLLPACTIAGTFDSTRSADRLQKYSGYVCMDYDTKVDNEEERQRIKEELSNVPYVRMVFNSPTFGLKAIVAVDSGLNYHKDANKQVAADLSRRVGIQFDEKTYDTPRLTFLSFDEDPYYYPDSEVFQVNTPVKEAGKIIQITSDNKDIDYELAYQEIYKAAERNKGPYQVGNRNDFVFTLTCFANCRGIPKEVFAQKLAWCDLPAHELQAVIRSGYKNEEKFGTWKQRSNTSNQNIQQAGSTQIVSKREDTKKFSDAVAENPIIPYGLKKSMPSLVGDVALAYTDSFQSDVALNAMLSHLSAIMTNVKSMHGEKPVAPNLSMVTIAASGSGKSVIDEVSGLFSEMHTTMKWDDKTPNGLFLPSDFTHASLIKRLDENEGTGMISCSDLGHMSYAFKGEGASLHATLSKAYSGEKLISNRSIDKAVCEVDFPQLVLAVGARPKQFSILVPSLDHGLFGRCLYYAYHLNGSNTAISSIDVESWTAFRQDISKRILKFYAYLKTQPLYFSYSYDQVDQVNRLFVDYSKEANAIGEEMTDYVRHLKTNMVKLAMVFGVSRACEEGSTSKSIGISDLDFQTVVDLTRVHFHHAQSVYNFYKDEDSGKQISKLQLFFEALPNGSFDRKTAIEISKTKGLKVSDRTVDNFLKKLVDTHRLIKDYNDYRKSEESSILKKAV